ncbi:MAG: phosphoglucosamine mutase [Candidatus Hadarchaeales archaeon]
MKAARLFGTSGVRGVFREELHPRIFLDLSISLSNYLENMGEVIVGRDTRITGEIIEGCVVSGLISGGCDVLRAGVVPTPALSFGVNRTGCSAGVMITASHNPPEYNGIKLWSGDGSAFDEDAERKIEEICQRGSEHRVDWKGIGTVSSCDIIGEYVEHIVSRTKLETSHNVVVDCGNGAASGVTPLLLRKMNCRIRTLNSNPDGHFPGRSPEPSAGSLADLADTVRRTGAELGIAHDGDADRVAIVDDRGRIAPPDKMLALVASHMIRKKGDIVVTTVDASSVVEKAVCSRGGKVVRTGVGDVNVGREIRKNGAVFGGEPSGAWIFPDIGRAPDGPAGAMVVMELIEQHGKLSSLLDSLPDFTTLREKIPCPADRKNYLMEAVREPLETEFKERRETLSIDGLRVSLDEGWVLVRPSGTEACIRVTVEGKNRGVAEEIMERARSCVKKALDAIS